VVQDYDRASRLAGDGDQLADRADVDGIQPGELQVNLGQAVGQRRDGIAQHTH
jgi:hypothetical protein